MTKTRADVEELWCETLAAGGQATLRIHHEADGVSARLLLDGRLRWTGRFFSDEQAERRGWALRNLVRSGDLASARLGPQPATERPG